jgi:Di-haem cytochrome c peroxidase
MRIGTLAMALALLAIGPSAVAQEAAKLDDLQWLDPDHAVEALSVSPRRYLRIEAEGGLASVLVTLGELAFRSPRILGGEARHLGLSCQTCHPNGAANTAFRLPGVSDRPGNVDVTHRQFNPAAEDGLDNPVNIPSLRGSARTAPYGRDGRSASLRDFIRAVIVTEFEGAEPPGWLLDALAAYVRQFAFLPGAPLRADGRLDATADDAAHRGEALFWRRFPSQPELSCAACHRPSAGFVDGLRHDVGSGGAYDTPSLLNLDDTRPYFHDGRFAGLAKVLAHFDRVYGLHLTAAEKRDLTAYLRAVGATRQPSQPSRLADDLATARRFSAVVAWAARSEDAPIGAFAAASLRHELGRIYRRVPQDGAATLRAELLALSLALKGMAGHFEAGDFIAARAAVPELEASLDRAWRQRIGAAGGSLYDTAVLQRSLGREQQR